MKRMRVLDGPGAVPVAWWRGFHGKWGVVVLEGREGGGKGMWVPTEGDAIKSVQNHSERTLRMAVASGSMKTWLACAGAGVAVSTQGACGVARAISRALGSRSLHGKDLPNAGRQYADCGTHDHGFVDSLPVGACRRRLLGGSNDFGVLWRVLVEVIVWACIGANQMISVFVQ